MEKLTCPSCDQDKMTVKKIRHTSSYANEEFDVLSPTMVCDHCGEQVMTSTQMNQLRNALADAYREKHGLLTSKQIVEYRGRLKKSQREFAEYLSVGEASVKRWETYYAQEKAMDEHIRAKCDVEYAVHNAIEVKEAVAVPNEFNGHARYSYARAKNAALILIPVCRSPLFVNKALFYADFLHFKKYGKGITGCQYRKLEYGPCPVNYGEIFKSMQNENLIQLVTPHQFDFKVLMPADESVFDDQERETLQYVVSLTRKDRGQRLFDLSHEEKVFTEAEPLEVISYAGAGELRIG